MSEIRTLHESSDYGQSSHYSSSLSSPLHPETTSAENGNPSESDKRLGQTSPEHDEAARSFSIPGISIPSAFILEVFLSGVKCVPSTAFQTNSTLEGGKRGYTGCAERNVQQPECGPEKDKAGFILAPSAQKIRPGTCRRLVRATRAFT